MAGEQGGGGSGDPGAGGGTGGTGNPWYHGKADAEMVGFLQTKGWDKDPVVAALGAAQAHREAEKFIGVPANEIIRVPKDVKDEAGWNAVWTRLGKPVDAKDYDLSAVKRADGSAPDQALTDLVRQTAHSLNLPKDAVGQLAQNILKHLDGIASEQLAVSTAKAAEAKAALEKNWGANKDAHLLVAKNALKAVALKAGLKEEQVSAALGALEHLGGVGAAEVMEMFRVVGSAIGEDKFITNPAPGGTGMMTREQAISKRADLMKDDAWVKRYQAGGQAEFREMISLNTIIAGDDTEASRRV